VFVFGFFLFKSIIMISLLGFEANSDSEELFTQDLDLHFALVCSQETTLVQNKNPA
jgi:hypothetical protein